MSIKKIIAYVFIGVVAVSAVAAFVLGTSRDSGVFDGSSKDAIAVLHLTGSIQDSGSSSLFGGGITPRSVARQLERAEKSKRVAAVVIRLNTGGGTVAASQEIADMVADFDPDRPVVVSMGDAAASGGYYVASQADHVVAQPGTLTGSVGVVWMSFDYADLMEKVGVDLQTVTAGEHKDMFLPGRMTPERRRIVQDLVDESYERFIKAVVKGRGLPETSVRALATGQVYTGQQALDLGLVDELGGLEKAIEAAEKLAGIHHAEIIEHNPSFFEALLGGPDFMGLRDSVRAFSLGPELVMLQELLNSYPTLRY